MEQRKFGSRGLKVSELCLGAMTFGREADARTSEEMLDAFVDAGGTFIDTANVYNEGVSEEILGAWLKNKKRDNLVIATKVRFPMGTSPNNSGLGRKHILDEVENSLRRLKTDYIDLYQVHCWDPNTPLEETLSTLNQLVETGKVRFIGASNFKGYQLQKAIDISRMHGWEPFSSLQPLYNMLDRHIEWELIELCRTEGLAILPWSPLRGGWLSGKYKKEDGAPPPNTRVHSADEKNWYETWANYATDRTWMVLDCIREIARDRRKSVAQVALNWVKNRPGITSPIIGARNMNQLTDNLGSLGWDLSIEEIQKLSAVSHLSPPYYPYGFINYACGLTE